MKYLWIATGVMLLLVTVLILIAWFTREKKEPEEETSVKPGTKPAPEGFWDEKRKKISGWFSKNYHWMILVALCHGIIWYTMPERYMVIMRNPFTWILHVAVFLIFKFGRTTERGKPAFTLVGRIAVTILLVATGITLYRWWEWETKNSIDSQSSSGFFGSIFSSEDAWPDRAYIRKFWKDGGYDANTVHKMVCIAWRESRFHQYDPEGDAGAVLTTKIQADDMSATGIYQIRKSVWGKKSEELGFNIETTDGNLRMAQWIYENNGFSPWGGDPGDDCSEGEPNTSLAAAYNPVNYIGKKHVVKAPVSKGADDAPWVTVETGAVAAFTYPVNGCVYMETNGDHEKPGQEAMLVCPGQKVSKWKNVEVHTVHFQSAETFPVIVEVRLAH